MTQHEVGSRDESLTARNPGPVRSDEYEEATP
jgi:hypothetical protein